MEYSEIFEKSRQIQNSYEDGSISRDDAIDLLNQLKNDAAADNKVFEFDESDLVDDSVETGEDYVEESEEYEESYEYSEEYDEDEDEDI